MMFDPYIRLSLIMVSYTVSIGQNHFLQVSRKSILDDHHDGIDCCLVLAPDLSAMKVQYTGDSSFAKDSKPDRRSGISLKEVIDGVRF